MKVLLIGSGGREHAIAWKLAQSPKLTQLYTLPGNPGTAIHGENIPGSVVDIAYIVSVAKEKAVDLVVVGPEDPLTAGLTDALRNAGIRVFGPPLAAAQLEGSKAFAKDFMKRYDIPTAAYQNFTDYHEAMAYVLEVAAASKLLPVIKASGLAAGKGVILPETLAEAKAALTEIMLEKKFGEAGAEVVIEEHLVGREVSILAFSDGTTIVPMIPAQDHKRLLEGGKGPNTGGMGVFAPSPYCPPELVQQAMELAIRPAIEGLRRENALFNGVLFTGFMMTSNGLKVLEYNCRFGDPETQAILPLLDADLLEIMAACADGKLTDIADRIKWKDAATVCVVLASGGYPDGYPKGFAIEGLDDLPEDVVAFHAGTRHNEGKLVTNGGRVLGITAVSKDLPAARALAYEAVERVKFDGMQYRTDIGKSF